MYDLKAFGAASESMRLGAVIMDQTACAQRRGGAGARGLRALRVAGRQVRCPRRCAGHRRARSGDGRGRLRPRAIAIAKT